MSMQVSKGGVRGKGGGVALGVVGAQGVWG